MKRPSDVSLPSTTAEHVSRPQSLWHSLQIDSSFVFLSSGAMCPLPPKDLASEKSVK